VALPTLREEQENEPVMPNFVGLTLREAIKKAKEQSIELKISGNGWAVRQYPPAHTPLGSERSCSVVFALND